MGYRGPTPKPSIVEIAEGRPGRRPVNRSEPQPRTTAPKCPDYLSDRAKEEWKRLLPILKRMRLLTEADGHMLGNLCQAIATLAQAQKLLNEKGLFYKSPSGYVMQSPALSVANQCIDQITKLSREFGLSPAARSRMMATGEPQGPTAATDALLAKLLSQPTDLGYKPKGITVGGVNPSSSTPDLRRSKLLFR